MIGSVAFGPVSSRRLGVSLGVNNIPAKNCTYSCVYCQVGKTTRLCRERDRYYHAPDVVAQVARKLLEVRAAGVSVDYITLVPDGEPTLDLALGEEIRLLKRLGMPVAVLTNSSLLWRGDVREDLSGADLVSVKVDAVDEAVWRRLNRPHPGIALCRVLEGIEEFARGFGGRLVSETMAVRGAGQDFKAVADFLDRLPGLRVAYLSTVTRPPAESWASPLSGEALEAAGVALSRALGRERVSVLACREGDLPPLSSIDDAEASILGIVSVHPLSEDALRRHLMEAGLGWEVVERLIEGDMIRVTEFEGKRFLRRNFELRDG